MKPGFLTTEFWTTVIASVIGICAAFGLFTKDEADVLTKNLVQIAGVLVPAIAAHGYSRSRGDAKKTEPTEIDKRLERVERALVVLNRKIR